MRYVSYLQLMRFHRPVGILLLLWPTLWALWIASDGQPDLKILAIFVLGVIIMRAAGCVINDIADRNFDGHVQRTSGRPLITGAVTLKEAIGLFLFLCVIALLLVLQLNLFTIKLSIVGLGLAIIYPFTKRITYWPQLVLGAAFSWGVPMAFAAQLNTVPMVAWWLFAAAVLWPLAYDTQYAMTDRADDEKIGMKSTAILFGHYDRLIIAIIQLLILLLLAGIGIYLNLKNYFYISLLFAALLFGYQQYLIKDRDPKKCFRAFLNNQWVGAIVFVGLMLS